MLNLKEWLGSKKTKDMLSSQVAIVIVCVVILYIAKGDPEQVKALVESLKEPLRAIAVLGGVGLLSRAGVDTMKAAKEKPKKPKR